MAHTNLGKSANTILTAAEVNKCLAEDGSGNMGFPDTGVEALPGLYPSGDTNTGIWSPAADTLAVSIGGTERVRVDGSNIDVSGLHLKFDNGKGIDFSASGGSGLTSAILDDYEEGIFTPVIGFTSASGLSTAVAVGFYTKVGNLVTIEINVVFTVSGGTAMTISALPFQSSSATSYQSALSAYANRVGRSGKTVGFLLTASSTTLLGRLYDNGVLAAATLDAADTAASAGLTIAGTYHV